MLKDVEAVIFDLDGTLVDSMWVWRDIDDKFLEKYQLTEPEGFHEGMEGKSYSETAQYFLDVFPTLTHTKEDLQKEWHEMAYERYASQIPLKTGALEFIKELYESGIKLGIATSNSRDLAEICLAHHKIASFFSSIWTACEAKAGKPDPAVYLRVSEELGVLPEKCLVFEDVPMGILAGKNAGMKVCAVEDSFSKSQEDAKRKLADYYIQDYFEIQKLENKNGEVK